MTGLLIFNRGRPDIALETGVLYGGLHCGDCFSCLIDGKWVDVRLEHDSQWVLVHRGTPHPICCGALVRI